MTNNSDGLIRSALRGNEETASRLRRTQLLGVLALVVATLASPVVRLADDDADVDDNAACLDGTTNLCDHGSHVAGIAAGAAGTDPNAPGDGVGRGHDHWVPDDGRAGG